MIINKLNPVVSEGAYLCVMPCVWLPYYGVASFEQLQEKANQFYRRLLNRTLQTLMADNIAFHPKLTGLGLIERNELGL